jgi:hypothetical protein
VELQDAASGQYCWHNVSGSTGGGGASCGFNPSHHTAAMRQAARLLVISQPGSLTDELRRSVARAADVLRQYLSPMAPRLGDELQAALEETDGALRQAAVATAKAKGTAAIQHR